MPDLSGKTFIVTGANSGIGYEASRALAAKGATVVLACRNLEKGQAAIDAIRAQTPGAKLVLERLDLGDLDTVRAFAAKFLKEHGKLDVLINNAGHHGHPADDDEGRLRDPDRHQSPGALRADGAPARAARRERAVARRHGQQHGAHDGKVRRPRRERPAPADRVHEVGRVRPEQAREPALRLRAAAAPRGVASRGAQRRLPPGLRGDEPAGGRPAR